MMLLLYPAGYHIFSEMLFFCLPVIIHILLYFTCPHITPAQLVFNFTHFIVLSNTFKVNAVFHKYNTNKEKTDIATYATKEGKIIRWFG